LSHHLREGRSSYIEAGSIVFSLIKRCAAPSDDNEDDGNNVCIVGANFVERYKGSGSERIELWYLRGELYVEMPPMRRGGRGLLPPRRVKIDENELMCLLIERGYKVVHSRRSVSIFEVSKFVGMEWGGGQRLCEEAE